MRLPIIDTTRTVSFLAETVEFDGIDREIWITVIRCPVDGIYTLPGYHATREEAAASWEADQAAQDDEMPAHIQELIDAVEKADADAQEDDTPDHIVETMNAALARRL